MLLLGSAAVSGAALAKRDPLLSDLAVCAMRAVDRGNGALAGGIDMQMLVRKDGRVYAAFTYAEQGIEDRILEHCVANKMLLWQFDPQPLDYARAYPLKFAPGPSSAGGVGTHVGASLPSVFMPAQDQVRDPQVALNVAAAQETLEIVGDAGPAERGLALLAVRRTTDAIAGFRQALARDANEALALRGLAEALATSQGDAAAGEARALAQRLIQLRPQSEAGHEALLRVCLAAGDDACAVREWQLARSAPDVAPRSRILSVLQGPTQAAADRLRAEARAADAGAATASPGGLCANESGDEAQALCEVKRCLDAGSATYAAELARQNGVEYVTGPWRTRGAGAGRMLVIRPIAPRGGGPNHDAIWLVRLGKEFHIVPSNSEAKQITLGYNACAVRLSPPAPPLGP